MRYVMNKVSKRMDAYRVWQTAVHVQRTLLLPLSFGASSLALLHLLDAHLQSQRARTGRTGYALRVVHITGQAADDGQAALLCSQSLVNVKRRYPDHEYGCLRLCQVFSSDDYSPFEVCGLPPPGDDLTDGSNEAKLRHLLASLPSATSRSDVMGRLQTRLIVQAAKEHRCESIVWADTTTRLAERTLAETAKGRGFSLPWQVSDGPSPVGLTFQYPLRDLLKKEVVQYLGMTDPPLSPLVRPVDGAASHVSASSKSTTACRASGDGFFASVEANFPSIMANVVRTSSKLRPAVPDDDEPVCLLCSMPVARGACGLHGWGGDQEARLGAVSHDGQGHAEERLCYGCARATLG